MSEPPSDERAPASSRPRRLLFRLGLALAALGVVVFVGGLALEAVVGLKAIPAQAIAYPIATVVFVLGALLALLDLEAGGFEAGAPKDATPTEQGEQSEARRRHRAVVLGLSLAALATVLLGVGTGRSLLLANSTESCASCHTALAAEMSAYSLSSHARVACVDCHVSPGVGSFVRARLVGLQQFSTYFSGQWEQPIPVPVANLRPTHEACETCHRPEKITGDLRLARARFADDEANTRTANTLVVHASGAPGAVGASGIHFSMLTRSEVRYFAADQGRQQIPWVEAIGQDGKSTIYRDTQAPLPASPTSDQMRRLDCIDCHSRPAHVYPTPDQALDASLESGAIDRSLPFVKREALAALDQPYPDAATARQQIEDRLRAFYASAYPSVAAANQASLDRAIAAVQGIYSQLFFPETKVDWQTYPDNLGHQRAPGCFRCHDGKHLSDSGRAIPSACDTCHSIPQTGPRQVSAAGGGAVPAILHTVEDRSDCLSCHATGSSGARAVPASHQGRTNDTCQACHRVDTAAAAKPAPKAIPHSIGGLTACLNCHTSGANAVPADHAGRTDDVCQSCHTPSPGATVVPSQAATAIPHLLEGRSDCLQCHASGSQAVPADHAGRTNETCQTCHRVDASAASKPTATAIPHMVAGFSACLTCHSSGPQAVPADHAGRGDDVCQSCHTSSPSAATAPPIVASTKIPHPLAGNADCLRCHAGGPQAVPSTHAGRTDATCQACHQTGTTVVAIPHVVAGYAQCLSCHSQGAQAVPPTHKGRTNDTCQFCHAPKPGVTALPVQAGVRIPHLLAGNSDCLKCHAGGSQAVPSTHAGRSNETCQTCHKPNTSLATVPHVVAGFAQCLSCHASGSQAVPTATHKGRANSSCQFCHAARPGVTVVPYQAAARIPHLVAGNSECLKCHASGSQAIPSSHAGRANSTCQVCHKPNTSLARIPHLVAGYTQCLSCHATGAVAMPLATHKGRTNSGCQFCHAPNPNATTVPLQRGRTIPHVVAGREACLSCHSSGANAVPASHAGRTNSSCRVCHAIDPAVANAPRIPHTVARFGDCLGCHAAGSNKVPASHAGRANSSCLGCHVQSSTAVTLPAGEPLPHGSNVAACLTCHRIGGEPGIPSDHAGRTSNVCRICH